MIKVKIINLDSKQRISIAELHAAIGKFDARPPAPRRMGGSFAHVGAIGPEGRATYQKLSAVFGPGTYRGGNCGISTLGAGSLANLRNLIQDT